MLALCLAIMSFGRPAIAAQRVPAGGSEFLTPNLIEVEGGRHLNMVCSGKGFPTVVFEQGGEGSLLNWGKVQPSVSKITRTCLYDRAGFGFSDPPDQPVTGWRVTDDLHALLKKAGVREPIVLVGHSIGGFYATLYTDRFASDVAGLVLVDPGFAGQFNPSPEERKIEQANIQAGGIHLAECADLAKQGKLSLDTPHDCFALGPSRTPDEAAYLLHMFTRPFWYEAELSQSENYFPSTDTESVDVQEERRAKRAFGDMPIVVLTAGIPARDQNNDAAYEEFKTLWKAGHDAIAARSTRGESIVVPLAHHFIQLDQPPVVIEAIGRVVAAIRVTERGEH
jgi:pimeloyl-ACP methyl ester carboxylesterase